MHSIGASVVQFGARERTWSPLATPQLHCGKHSLPQKIALRTVTSCSHLTGSSPLPACNQKQKPIFADGLLFLVRQCDLSWNQIEPSILLMYQKLKDLGFEYYDGRIVLAEPIPLDDCRARPWS